MDEQIITKIRTGYPNYSITNSGIIKNLKTKKNLKGTIGKDGYISVKLINNSGRKSHKVHRLVAEAFLKNIEKKPTVDHKDRNKINTHVINLKWATSKEQNQNKKHSTNQRETLSRSVNRIDVLTNSIIKTYASLVEAKEWLIKNKLTTNKQAITGISQVCNGKNKTAYGFKWSFTDNISIDNEIWIGLLPELVDGTKGYKISNLGRIKGRTGRINAGWGLNGYIQVSVGKKTYALHRLVAKAFIISIDPKQIEVNHKDGNKKNNTTTNLEWVTHTENVQHAFDTGLSPTKPVIQYDLSGTKIRSYHSIAEAERALKLEISSISKALDKEKRAHGFIWRTTEVNNAIPEKITFTTSNKPYKKIIQYKSDGITFIREFESSKEVSECFNVKIHSVNNWCSGNRKNSKGFIFKYK